MRTATKSIVRETGICPFSGNPKYDWHDGTEVNQDGNILARSCTECQKAVFGIGVDDESSPYYTEATETIDTFVQNRVENSPPGTEAVLARYGLTFASASGTDYRKACTIAKAEAKAEKAPETTGKVVNSAEPDAVFARFSLSDIVAATEAGLMTKKRAKELIAQL